MSPSRKIVFIVLLLAGGSLIALFFSVRPKTPFDTTLAPVFQLLGKTTKSVNRALSRVIPVSDLDEKKYGETIYSRYVFYTDPNSEEFIYLNDLLKHISQYKKKPFEYRVLYLKDKSPNAFAMPGGVIFVTQGLLDLLQSEAELVSVLAHEMGHVERSHCFDMVRFELLARKMKAETLGKLADFAVNLMLRHTFSKTQEDEADEYAYELILNTRYDPAGLGYAFHLLAGSGKARSARENNANILRDYLMSHPHPLQRSEKFGERARRWYEQNPGVEKYGGRENLKRRRSLHGGFELESEKRVVRP